MSSPIVTARVFAKNLLANWVGLFADVIVAFFLTPYIIGSLGLVVYGIWSLVNTLVGYFGLIDMGIRGSVGRYINYYLARNDDRRVGEVVSTSLVFLTVMSIVVIGIAYLVGQNFVALFPKTPPEFHDQVAFLLPIMAINLWLAFLIAIFRNVLGALDRYDIATGINLVALILRTIGVVVVLRSGHGIGGLALVTLAVNWFIATGMALAAMRRYPTLVVSLALANRERFAEIWKFGLTAFVTRSASQLVYESGQVVAMYFLGPAAVGVYSVATMLIQNARSLIEQIGVTIYPSVMRAGSVKDFPALRAMFDWYARISFLLALLLYLGLAVFGGRFIELWVGPEFSLAFSVLQLLAIGELGQIFTSTGTLSLFALDRVRFNLYIAVLEALLNLAISIVLLALTHSIIGAAIGFCLPMFLFRGIIIPIVCTRILEIPYKEYMRAIGRPVSAIVATTGLLFLAIDRVLPHTGWPTFIIGVVIASSLYAFPSAALLLGKQRTFETLKKVFQARSAD